MKKVLFFDCAYGISGDMTLGALLDLGVEFEYLKSELQKVRFGGYELQCLPVNRYGVPAKKVNVLLDLDDPENGKEKNPDDVLRLIDESGLSDQVKQKAREMIEILAQAQAQAHRIPWEAVHFHERGAVDSLVDVIGAAICIDRLNADAVYFTPLSDGIGFIHCRYGHIPVPVPATRIITRQFHLPVQTKPIESELVTPTGAAITAVMAKEFRCEMPQKAGLVKTGAGAGDYDYGEGGYLKCSLYTMDCLEEPEVD